MIEIDAQGQPEIIRKLQALATRSRAMRPAMREISEHLVAGIALRFRDGEAPDGSAWQELSDVTKALRRKGPRAEFGDKPLRNTNLLSASFDVLRIGDDFVSVGTPKTYAHIHQFGGVTSPRSMIPNKRIPARPMLGISASDRRDIIATIDHYLREALR